MCTHTHRHIHTHLHYPPPLLLVNETCLGNEQCVCKLHATIAKITVLILILYQTDLLSVQFA